MKNNDDKREMLVTSVRNLKKDLESSRKFRDINKDTDFEQKFYENIYQGIKNEMLLNLDSELFYCVLDDEYEKKIISSLIEKDIRSLLDDSGLSSIHFNKLYTKYEECKKNEDIVNKDLLLLVVFFQNRKNMKSVINDHFNRVCKDIKVNAGFLSKHYDEFSNDVSYYEEMVKGIRRNQFKINASIGSRFIALALTFTVLGVGNYFGLKKLKKLETTTQYETTINRIAVGENGQVIDRFKNEYLLRELSLEEKYVIRNYSDIFTDEEKNYRYYQDYSFPYIDGTPLEDYASLEISSLKPYGNVDKSIDAARRYEGSDVREVIVYEQNLDKPYVEADNIAFAVEVALLGLIDALTSCCLLYDVLIYKLPTLNLKKRRNREDYEKIINYLGELLTEMKNANVNLEEAYKRYGELVRISDVLGLNVNERYRNINNESYGTFIAESSERIRKLKMK